MGAVLHVNRVRESVWDEHQAIADAIADAIAAGDMHCADKLMSPHGDQAAAYLSTICLTDDRRKMPSKP